MLTPIKEHSIVLLKDGQQGTVMHVHTDASGAPVAYMIDTGTDFGDWPSVTIDQIEQILWEPKTAAKP